MIFVGFPGLPSHDSKWVTQDCWDGQWFPEAAPCSFSAEVYPFRLGLEVLTKLWLALDLPSQQDSSLRSRVGGGDCVHEVDGSEPFFFFWKFIGLIQMSTFLGLDDYL